ncbi:MAG: tRNA (N6-threonylcarbamoyladenosine(37)-N6)-methyltransferase TrmO [Deltaproteobacteria bacterium]|nr:tRNA (N6-threonylcarbamoyladenosine(37)-N6)-methyltransferase TrmO [Deltaproteobacteria bacterium]
MEREYVIHPIGFVRSAVKSLDGAPKQGALAGTEAEIVVYEIYADALEGLAMRTGPPGEAPFPGDTHRKSGKIIVMCWMDRADRARRKVHPRGRENSPERGVFSTRSPHRPNPISIHTVELLEVRGTVLRVRGMDAVDGTPVVDIKPHSPELDG